MEPQASLDPAYLLDTSILSCFFRQEQESALAACTAAVQIITLEEVCDELRRDPRVDERLRRFLPSSGIKVASIPLGSIAHDMLCQLHPKVSLTKNLGERACIALAATQEPAATFVASDKGAMWIALRELHQPGVRLLGLHVFLRRLHESAGLPLPALDAVAAESHLPLPLWWLPWRRAPERQATAQAG